MVEMNKELVLKIADAIEKHPESYYQASFGIGRYDFETGCGAACCVCGLAVILGGVKLTHDCTDGFTTDLLRREGLKALGITDHSGRGRDMIALARWPLKWRYWAGLEDRPRLGAYYPTPSDAVAILRAMAQGGKFWNLTIPEKGTT